MKNFKLVSGLVVFLFLLYSPLTLAQGGCMKMMQMQGPDKPCGMMKGGDECCGMCGLMKNAEKLGLTAEQQDKLKAMHFEAKKSKIKLGADIELAELELKHLMMADKPSESEILKAVDNLGALKTKIQKFKIQRRLASEQILNAEQQAKWKELKKECKMQCKHKMMMAEDEEMEMPGMEQERACVKKVIKISE